VHTLDAQSGNIVGRSLELVGKKSLKKISAFKEIHGYQASVLVLLLPLQHRTILGNPPFGHSGENHWRIFFLSNGQKYKDNYLIKNGKI
jgi:dGTP triphosphohydrolase